METPYDWITLGIFAALIVLFLQRSTGDDDHSGDSLWMYLTAGAGCAVANFLGNEGRHFLAILAIVTTLAFVFRVLKPFTSSTAD